MQITDELRVIIEAEVERAVRDMEKWDKSVEGTQKKLDDLEKAADKMAGRLTKVSVGFTAVGAAGLKFYSNLEESSTSFEVLIGDAEKAAKTLKEVQEYSQKTSYSSGAIEDATIQLLNYQVAAEDVVDHLKMIGDVAMGNAGKMESVTRAYGRIQLKGRASMEELNMLTEAGVPILAKLGQNAGVSAEAIMKMASEGRVSADMVIRAFQDMTSEGGQFQDMAQKQSQTLKGLVSTVLDQASMALAKVVKPLVPTVKELLAEIGKAAEAFGNMNDGAKRAFVSVLAIGVAAGPIAKTASATIGLVKGIMGLASMNPVVLGLMAVVGAVSLLAGAMLKAKMEAVTYNDQLDRFKKSQAAAAAAAKSYEELAGTVPGLTRAMYDAAKATGKFDEAVEQAGKLSSLRQELASLEKAAADKTKLMVMSFDVLRTELETPINPNAKGWWEGAKNAEEKFRMVRAAIEGMNAESRDFITRSTEFRAAFDAKNFSGMLKAIDALDFSSPATKAKIEALKKSILEIGSGVTITPKVAPPSSAETRKTWQEWWQEITGVDKSTFRNGAQAAKLYLDGVASETKNAEAIAKALGEKFNPLPYLEKEQDKIRGTLIDILKIPPEEIAAGDAFNFGKLIDAASTARADASIQALVDRYKELAGAIKAATDERDRLSESEKLAAKAADLLKAIETPLDRYKSRLAEIDEIWKNQEYEGQLLNEEQYLKLVAAAGDQYKDELEAIRKAQDDIKRASFDEWLKDLSKEFWLSIGASDLLAESLAEIGTQIAMTTISGLVDGFKELGEAWADGTLSAEDLGDALSNVAKQILDMLPMLFVQAGLNLIANGQWALGLGFIAGGVASAIIGGLNEGIMKNAKGNIFDSGSVVPFAKGGAFTNGVVTKAMRFNIGEMGERGPEAIVPLRRMSDGSLGVASASGQASGGTTNIHIANYTGQPIQRRESQAGSGRDIEIIVGSVTDKLIGEGRFDSANQGRYGFGRRPVRA